MAEQIDWLEGICNQHRSETLHDQNYWSGKTVEVGGGIGVGGRAEMRNKIHHMQLLIQYNI